MKETKREAPAARKPENVPEKFRDGENGSLNVEELLKSYLELEKKMGAAGAKRDANVLDLALATDGAGAEYDIVLKHRMLAIDEAVNLRLKAAGFTNAQAQLVYDLAAEVMMPMVEDLMDEFRAYRELEKLEEHFGGEERFDEISRQISQWAEKNVPADIFDALSSSYYGIIALYNMMSTSEPGIVGEGGEPEGALSEKKLREMMHDPRYWRDGDKDFIRKVDDGFKALYDNK